MLYFANPGELDMRLTQLFGASVKSETAIGKFGTGLKYAIAVCLRHNDSITIHSGTTAYHFTKRVEAIRGKEFGLIYMNDTQMPFTTDLGKHWEPWMAYRELWANAQDEGGSVGQLRVLPTAGHTVIEVDCKELEEAHKKRHEFIILENKTPYWHNDSLEIYNEPSTAIFYRNIKVLSLTKPCKYTYNILSSQDLTEDRTLPEWTACHTIMHSLQDIELPLLEQIATAPNTTFEHKFDFTDIYFPKEKFLTNISELTSRRALDINQTMLSVALKRNGVDKFQQAFLTPVESKMLQKASAFCSNLGYKDVPIKIAAHLGDLVLGVNTTDTIWLSKLVFQKGTKQVAATLLEEYLHHEKRLPDQSREMQNFLLEWVVSLLEEKTGEPL